MQPGKQWISRRRIITGFCLLSMVAITLELAQQWLYAAALNRSLQFSIETVWMSEPGHLRATATLSLDRQRAGALLSSFAPDQINVASGLSLMYGLTGVIHFRESHTESAILMATGVPFVQDQGTVLSPFDPGMCIQDGQSAVRTAALTGWFGPVPPLKRSDTQPFFVSLTAGLSCHRPQSPLESNVQTFLKSWFPNALPQSWFAEKRDVISVTANPVRIDPQQLWADYDRQHAQAAIP